MPLRAYSARVRVSSTTFPSFMEAWMKCRLPSSLRQAMPVWVMSSPETVLTKQMMSPSRMLSSISGIRDSLRRNVEIGGSGVQTFLGPSYEFQSPVIFPQLRIIVLM